MDFLGSLDGWFVWVVVEMGKTIKHTPVVNCYVAVSFIKRGVTFLLEMLQMNFCHLYVHFGSFSTKIFL